MILLPGHCTPLGTCTLAGVLLLICMRAGMTMFPRVAILDPRLQWRVSRNHLVLLSTGVGRQNTG